MCWIWLIPCHTKGCNRWVKSNKLLWGINWISVKRRWKAKYLPYLENQGESVSVCLSPHALLTYSFSALDLRTTHIITNIALLSAACVPMKLGCRFPLDVFFLLIFLMMEAYFPRRGELFNARTKILFDLRVQARVYSCRRIHTNTRLFNLHSELKLWNSCIVAPVVVVVLDISGFFFHLYLWSIFFSFPFFFLCHRLWPLMSFAR